MRASNFLILKLTVAEFRELLSQLMELLRDPLKGVITDVKGRAAWYKHDWVAGFCSGFRSVSLNYSYVVSLAPLHFPGLPHSLSIFLSIESSGYWHLPCTYSLLLLFLSSPLGNN
jgi:hypothetical protein